LTNGIATLPARAAFANDLGHVEQLDLAAADDRMRSAFRDQPLGGLRTRERGLEAQHRVDEGAVAEGAERFGCGKKTFKNTHAVT
jgi:hypothetical protein